MAFLRIMTLLSLGLTLPLHALKVRVGLLPAEDNWIILGDGSQIVLGQNVSALLGHYLQQDGRFVPTLEAAADIDQNKNLSFSNKALAQRSSQVIVDRELVGEEAYAWIQQAAVKALEKDTQLAQRVDVHIKPVIEALLYTTGERSNRVVYGFSPNHDNPFRRTSASTVPAFGMGNEFAPSFASQAVCLNADYFQKAFATYKTGAGASNFGFDADEGTALDFGGFGLGFKEKKYSVRMQVRFDVSVEYDGRVIQKSFNYVAQGRDVWLAGSYRGFSLAVEIHRRETLIAALQKLIPTLIQDFVPTMSAAPITRMVAGVDNGQILLEGGAVEGMAVGDVFQDPRGNAYRVTYVYDTLAEIFSDSGAVPVLGDILKYVNPTSAKPVVAPASILSMGMTKAATVSAIGSEQTTKSFTLDLANEQRAVMQVATVEKAQCEPVKKGLFEDFLKGVLYPLAVWRYMNIFDEDFKGLDKDGQKALAAPVAGKIYRVGFMGPGVDYNDKDLQLAAARAVKTSTRAIKNPGFDFISLDARATDVNGQGTVSAKYFASQVKKPWALIPIKVIGPRGETHSGAIYDGFKYAAEQNLDLLVISWRPDFNSVAFAEGRKLAEAAGVKVFMSAVDPFTDYIDIDPVTMNGLGGRTLRLKRIGADSITEAARWLNGM